MVLIIYLENKNELLVLFTPVAHLAQLPLADE